MADKRPPPDTPATPRPDPRFRIINRIGMIDMLSAAMATRLLDPLGLSASLFGLLNHFAEAPDQPRTVMALAREMQVPQPGVTKRVQKLLALELVREAPSPHDARKKLLTITPQGVATHRRALDLLVPTAVSVFDGWPEDEVSALLRALDRLKATLDGMI